MTDQQILEWVEGLSFNPSERPKIITDLLKYRRKDKMSEADEKICRRALTLLSTVH